MKVRAECKISNEVKGVHKWIQKKVIKILTTVIKRKVLVKITSIAVFHLNKTENINRSVQRLKQKGYTDREVRLFCFPCCRYDASGMKK